MSGHDVIGDLHGRRGGLGRALRDRPLDELGEVDAIGCGRSVYGLRQQPEPLYRGLDAAEPVERGVHLSGLFRGFVCIQLRFEQLKVA